MATGLALLPLLFALAESPNGRHAEEGHANVVGLRPGYALNLNRPRTSMAAGEEAPSSDNLGGFVLSYERVLYREWLALELCKPFYFGKDRFDSPFEVSLRFQRRWGRVEPFLTAGLTWNIRVFEKEREEIEGKKNVLSFGITGATGVDVWLTSRWALDGTFGYTWVALGAVVQHELALTIGPLFAF